MVYWYYPIIGKELFMYGKRFVTGDRQKACLFEQKGSYMASIKDWHIDDRLQHVVLEA